MSEIKAGDVVRLKSGGPWMTVSQVDKDTFGTMTAWCHWHDEKKFDAKEGTFPLNPLMHVSGSKNL